MKLAVILGTTREGRLSERLATWIANEAGKRPDTTVDLIDLKAYPLPFFNEPKSPRYNSERHIDPTAQRLLDKLTAAEAYIFVTPEYNHSIPAVLKNAFDYVTWEMAKKPAAVASHGTVGGARATMHLKEIISESRAVPIPAHLAITDLGGKINPDGTLTEAEQTAEFSLKTRLDHLLDELQWYSDALTAARAKS